MWNGILIISARTFFRGKNGTGRARVCRADVFACFTIDAMLFVFGAGAVDAARVLTAHQPPVVDRSIVPINKFYVARWPNEKITIGVLFKFLSRFSDLITENPFSILAAACDTLLGSFLSFKFRLELIWLLFRDIFSPVIVITLESMFSKRTGNLKIKVLMQFVYVEKMRRRELSTVNKELFELDE